MTIASPVPVVSGRYIPEGNRVYVISDLFAVYYNERERQGKTIYCALGFLGRSKNQRFSYYFRSEEQRDKYCNEFISNVQSNANYRTKMSLKRKAARVALMESIVIGDVLYNSWGYDQTNIDYYQVVGKTAAKLRVREIGQDRQYTQSMAGQCVPTKDFFLAGKDAFLIAPDKYSQWSGRSNYFSEYA